MSKSISVIVREIKTDGLPDIKSLTGRVAFIFDGDIVSGWPLVGDDGCGKEFKRQDNGNPYWTADDDVGRGGKFSGVTHWVEFPVPIWDLER